MSGFTEDAIVITSFMAFIFLLILLCSGDPDLLDAIIKLVMSIGGD